MDRYILRFRGDGSKPAADVEVIRALPHTKIVDEDSNRMLLVEAPKEELLSAMELLPNWILAEERMLSIPTPPRPTILKKVGEDH
jgi:hypothetical protein